MRIGETLLREGLISEEQLKSALSEQELTHDRLGDILLKKGLLTHETIAPVLAKYFQVPFIRIKDTYKDIKTEVLELISSDLAHRFKVIPIELNDKILVIATADPLDLMCLDTLRLKTGYRIQCVLAVEREISEAIDYCYHSMPKMKEYIEDFIDTEVQRDEGEEFDPDKLRLGASEQPVVKYVKSLIIQAVNNGASDVHLQPKQDRADLRFRIDGVLHHFDPPPKSMLPAISTRIKILSGLDIAERRLPQDGRFKVNIGQSEVDIRTSIFPTIYGESVVLRLLDTSKPLLGMDRLGFLPNDLERFRTLIYRSYGLILVTGPTGSGKTTTLYTTLNEIKSAEKNIITLEDPVEYRLPFIQQSQINSKIGFDFLRGLRSILRQDPDVIMIGEIRDQETAEIAIHASLTGHLVFATLHTNDAAGAPVRLTKMGVEPFLITSSLLGVVAQRLMRRICPHCRITYKVEQDVLDKMPIYAGITHFSRGTGCPKCLHSGYKAREGIYEVLLPNEAIKKLILSRASTEEIRKQAQKAGMKTLREIGLDKLRSSITTPEEFMRVTQETEDY